MNLAFHARRSLRVGGALAFIVLGALSAAQARSDPLAEAYVLGLIGVAAIGAKFLCKTCFCGAYLHNKRFAQTLVRRRIDREGQRSRDLADVQALS